MNRGDFLWLAVLAAISSVLLLPAPHQVFVALTKQHPYLMGFIKFAVLATMGELLAIRIVTGSWRWPPGVTYRAVVWGLFGVVIVLMFDVFSGGINAAISKGMLWVGDGSVRLFMTAFWISAIMNLAFAPTFMTAHRITDAYIDMHCGEGLKPSEIRLSVITAKIDWQGLVSFVVLRTIPLFWIPAHTLTFLLPPEYRILVAAYLSIALGAILAYAKRRKLGV